MTARLEPWSDTSEIDLPAELVAVGHVVSTDGGPNFNHVDVVLEPDVEVTPGQLLAIWHGARRRDLLTVVQVGACKEINPNEAPELSIARQRLSLGRSYAPESMSTRIYRQASCDTLEEVAIVFGPAGVTATATAAPQTLPRSADIVVVLPPNLAQASIGGKPDPDRGLHLGSTMGSNPVEVTLTPEILQMHTLITGAPGKGKSYFEGVLMEEARAWDVPLLVIDLNGEFVETAESMGGLVIRLPDEQKFGLTLSILTSREIVSIAPNVQLGTNYAELIELTHGRIASEKGQGVEFTFAELDAKMEELGRGLSMTAANIATARARARGLANDKLMQSSGSSFDFIGKLKEHGIVVLDCRYLSVRQTQLIAAAAARRLQTFGRTMARKAMQGDEDAAKWFAMLFVDEAHTILPNSENVVSTQVLNQLSRMGRHVRTGLVLASQSPADLDRSVLKKMQTRFIFAIERDQLSAINGVSADLGEDLIAGLPKLPRGVCAVSGTSELIRHGFLLKVRPRRTPVGGGTPPVFAFRQKAAAHG